MRTVLRQPSHSTSKGLPVCPSATWHYIITVNVLKLASTGFILHPPRDMESVDQDPIIELTTPAASGIPKIRNTHFSMAPKVVAEVRRRSPFGVVRSLVGRSSFWFDETVELIEG